MHIGCHVSIAGGIQNASKNAFNLGCECFQIFTRSPQGGNAPEITPKIADNFKSQATSYNLQAWYLHAPYYINFASVNNRIRYGSVAVIRDELERGTLLGAKYVMTHLGTAKDFGEKESIKKTVAMLKKTLEGYIGETKLLLENSAGAGMIIGDDLKELSVVIEGVNSKFIAGVCLDTQHSFVSGYDWRDTDTVFKKIDAEIGLDKIKLFHCNDSQSEFGSRKDRHAHIGQGKIGLDAFKNIVAFAEKNKIDMITETDHDAVIKDMELLKNFRAGSSNY